MHFILTPWKLLDKTVTIKLRQGVLYTYYFHGTVVRTEYFRMYKNITPLV